MKSPKSSQRGVALIIVLAMLILLSGIIVSFMSTAANERAASDIHASSTTTRQIADSTVNLVISQIREATSQEDPKTTWSSQPGAIRTFSGSVGVKKPLTKGPSGASQFTYNPGGNDFIYKLYSADLLKVPASAFGGSAWDKQETTFIERWDRSNPTDESKQYVDLNEPILSQPPSGANFGQDVVEPRYPIIDPRAKMAVGEKINSNAAPGIVDGFDVRTSDLTDSRMNLESGAPVPYLPMPVKWIYQLRDGSLTSASKGTKNNPIVGRTAWWVDDDSTKLNINTASEGTFWDTPSTSSELESGSVSNNKDIVSSNGSLSLGAAQPARGEYQRYPGHPATTSLSPVLGWLWDILPGATPLPTRDLRLVTMKDELVRISPFIPYGNKNTKNESGQNSTSMAGTYNVDKDLADPNPNNPDAEKPPRLLIPTKHLYATVDELLFAQDRFDDSNKPILNNARLTPDALEKVRFFLTANSRAPEINLFGRPRVTIWPVNAKEELRTSYDDLFAFTSTLYRDPNFNRSNDKPFFFTRYDAKNGENDFKNSPPNSSAPNRNRNLYNYLKFLTGDGPTIPGFGGTFAAKYSNSERDQILVMMYDYMRAVNLVDTGTVSKSGKFQPYTPFFGVGTSGYKNQANRSNDWSGQVTPIRTTANAAYQGLGRFFTISEAAIIFYRTGTIRPNPDNTQAEIQATLALGLATPMPGFPVIRETFYTKVKAVRGTFVSIPALGIADRNIELVSDGDPKSAGRVNISNVASHDVANGRNFMPTLGFVQQMHYYQEPSGWTDVTDLSRPKPNLNAKATPKIFAKDASTLDGEYRRQKTVTYYPYISNPFPAPPKGAAEMTLKAGAFEVQIWSGEAPDDPRSQLVQTVYLDFGRPNAPELGITVPIPGGVERQDASFQKRLTGQQDEPREFFDSKDDVIRGLELIGGITLPDGSIAPFTGGNQGDIRLAMARRLVPTAFFQPRNGLDANGKGDYTSKAKRVFAMHSGHGELYKGEDSPAPNPGGLPPRLAKNGTNNGKIPIVPRGINGVTRYDGGPGDYDRGLSKHLDGAFANKVDEGNVFFGYNDSGGGKIPYYRGRSVEETGRSFFSPNRQISSAVMFGSIPTGVIRGRPWQTLLFRPDRGGNSHPGAQTTKDPADHLFLDLFHLPVVEPYAISEPFSTAGKVNLNYVIAPFGYAAGDKGNIVGTTMPRSYVRRDTALRGILKAVKMMAVPTGEANSAHAEDPLTVSKQFRWDIDADRTLDLFEDRLKDPDRGLFRSASEICDMDLFPRGISPAISSWSTFWDNNAQTGDNMRERPYSYIYPRVTTKSNVFTVHMRCQAIKKAPSNNEADQGKFIEGRDQITSEYRGSAVIERFIDPNDPNLIDYNEVSKIPSEAKVDPFYRFRIVSTKQFAPR